ncbi:MAG TPA: M23 family metallopeptidase [Thermoanaerobaculia bacterium]|nr:M23 family metallopeptidase [Thermoanaerobaculia bacterium]
MGGGRRASPRPCLEIQVHGPDIRRGVRYFFLTRGHLALGAAMALAWLAGIAGACALAPRVVRDVMSRGDYERLQRVRSQQGERLEMLLSRLSALDSEADQLRHRIEKVYLAYGLTRDGAGGQGGFPFAAAAVPQSLYAGAIEEGNRLQAEIAEELRVLSVFLEEVQAFEEGHRDQVLSTPSISPLKGYEFLLTSPFGTRRSPFTKKTDFHAGIDLAAPAGTPIHAPASGTVIFAGRYDLRKSVGWWRYGNLVVVRHNERFVTLFGHCREVQVRAGQQVAQGDVIATVGNTGWSTSPHLHYEVRRLFEQEGYRPVDPRIYILDHRWRDEEKLLVRARSAPDSTDYEPLPTRFAR